MVIHEKKTVNAAAAAAAAGENSADAVETMENLVKVPLVDKHAQGALRRRVVHDQLERT